jgi:hypothetical protein
MKNIKPIFIQIADSIFRRKYRNIEHRRFIRLKDSLSLDVRLVDYHTREVFSRQIKSKTLNISREGLCIETSTVTVNGVDVFNDAMSDDKNLEIEINDSQSAEKILAIGKVVWFDMTPKQKSFLFTAGVYITLMEPADKDKWYNLVENAKKYNKEKQWFFRMIKK